LRRWALPTAATLALITSGGVAINLASFDPPRFNPVGWAKRARGTAVEPPAPVAVEAEKQKPAPPRSKRARPPKTARRAVQAATAAPPSSEPFGSVYVVAPAGTMISIGGAQVGMAPISLSVPKGTHEIIGRGPDGAELHQMVDVQPQERIEVTLTPPSQ
jgi:hypothetical protein